MIDVAKNIKDSIKRQVALYKETKEYKEKIVERNKLSEEIQKLREDIIAGRLK